MPTRPGHETASGQDIIAENIRLRQEVQDLRAEVDTLAMYALNAQTETRSQAGKARRNQQAADAYAELTTEHVQILSAQRDRLDTEITGAETARTALLIKAGRAPEGSDEKLKYALDASRVEEKTSELVTERMRIAARIAELS